MTAKSEIFIEAKAPLNIQLRGTVVLKHHFHFIQLENAFISRNVHCVFKEIRARTSLEQLGGKGIAQGPHGEITQPTQGFETVTFSVPTGTEAYTTEPQSTPQEEFHGGLNKATSTCSIFWIVGVQTW